MYRILRVTVILALFSGAVTAQTSRILQGEVFHLGENGEKVIEPGLIVSLKGFCIKDDTNDDGLFRLALPVFMKPGETVMLTVDKPGWRIRYPLDGEARIPDDLDKELIEVELLPVGSKLFWTDDRIEKFIADLAEQSTRQLGRQGEPRFDFSRALREWAAGYGVNVEEARKEIDRWIAEVEARHDNEYELGLADFAKRDFVDAARHFQESATWRAGRLVEIEKQEGQIREEKARLKREVVRDLRMQGYAYSNAYRFKDALATFQSVLERASREASPQLWADALLDVGITQRELGIRVESDLSARYLASAVETYRMTLEVRTREELSRAWAMTQDNLGNALSEQGLRTGGESGARLLVEAVDVYRLALKVRTRENLPQDWAMTQNNLGNTLRDQGIRMGGESAARLLAEAADAFRLALQVYKREDLPHDWAMTQNNLGNTLRDQGIRTGGASGARLLAEAADALRLALQVYSRKDQAQLWAGTQSNLGNVLAEQGIRTGSESGARLLAEAVDAYRLALQVRTREDLPQQWARTQNNLGNALSQQGIRTIGELGTRLLAEAVDAFRLALRVRIREDLPQQWARTQNNLV